MVWRFFIIYYIILSLPHPVSADYFQIRYRGKMVFLILVHVHDLYFKKSYTYPTPNLSYTNTSKLTNYIYIYIYVIGRKLNGLSFGYYKFISTGHSIWETNLFRQSSHNGETNYKNSHSMDSYSFKKMKKERKKERGGEYIHMYIYIYIYREREREKIWGIISKRETKPF